VVHVFRLAVPAGLDEQFAAWLVEASRVGGLPCDPEKEEHSAVHASPAELRPPARFTIGALPGPAPGGEMHDMICPCLTYLDGQQAMAELTDVALDLAPARLEPLPGYST
jgi:hypothetical protein